MTNEEFSLFVGAILDDNGNKVEEVSMKEVNPTDEIIGSIRFGTKNRLFRLFQPDRTKIGGNNTLGLATLSEDRRKIKKPQKEFEIALKDLAKKWGEKLSPEAYEYLKQAFRKDLFGDDDDEFQDYRASFNNTTFMNAVISLLKFQPHEYERIHKIIQPDTRTIHKLVAQAQAKIQPKKILH